MCTNKDYSTASSAGNTEGREWTTSHILVIRLTELINLQYRLIKSDLASNLDEVASARRAMQRLMGPSGGQFFQKEDDRYGRKCWRHLVPTKEQAILTLHYLKEGL